MPSNVYDQAGRYLAKLDAVGFLAYALELPRSAFRFRLWLDTRLLPFPGQPDRTCDTVAHLEDLLRGGIPWALILEFQIDPDEKLFGRLLGYGGLVWLEKRPSPERGDRFALGAAVVNFRGRGDTSRQMNWVEAGLAWGVKVKDVNVADQHAAALLAAIETGELARVVLPLVPLMQGGDRDDMIQQWVRLASAEPDAARRGDWGGLALVFAEAAGCRQPWQAALKEWNVIQSQQVLEWQAQARSEGRIEGRIETLIDLLEARFGSVPEPLVQNLRALTDPVVLKRLVHAATQTTSLDDFSKTLPH